MDPLFSIETYEHFLSIYGRDLIALDVNMFLILAAALVGIAVKIYRYRKDTIKVEPLLGVVGPRKKK
jgi:putative exporter of polyketide antibiotics